MAFLLDSQMPLTSLEPSRRKLVVSVIEEYHGPIVATVAEVLMRAEKMTLAELTRLVQRDQGIMGVSRAGKTKMKVTIANVKESLLILTQHNVIRVEMPTERELRRARAVSSGTANIRLHYSLLPLDVLVRSRGPHFHAHACRKYGKVAGMIVDCFMRHGRRTLPDIKEELLRRASASSAGASFGNGDDVEGTEEEVTVGSIQKVFEEMVMGKFIDKVKKLNLVTPGVEPERAKKPSMTFAKIAATGKGGTDGDGAATANVQNAELAARQEKAAAQTNARKRRLLGHDSNGASKNGSGGHINDTDDEEDDELPVEMRNLTMTSIDGRGAASSGGNSDRPGPAKRLRRTRNLQSSADDSKASTAPTRSRSRGRGRSRGGAAGRGKGTNGKGKANDGGGGGVDMEGVFEEEGVRENEDGVNIDLLGRGERGAGAGAAVLDTVVWKLGIDQFHRDFRHLALLGLVQDRFPKSKLAYLAVKIMLEISAMTERSVQEEITANISARTLFDKLCEAWPTDPLTRNRAVPDWRRFVSWMSALCSDLTNMVSKIPGSDAQNPRYVVNMARMVRYIKSNLVKCTIRDRYGKETARMVEILLQNTYLEQSQVAEMAMIPSGDARGRLYRLLKDRMVSVQEVPKRADRNPNTTFYLWTIKHDQELLNHNAAARAHNDVERKRLDKVKGSLDRLDTALLRLDENLMVFNTF